ncbi:DUF423 domain-containing protein [Paenibacillus sediminis]|uniref:Uncharacterized membrane protein YgdD (TMEM256/DUF423 family) n=1 Tax=Paenibacillus sediminis TaxID=664909 RepID=A0ABS4H5N4_9BACL|nr:DUF423 domain-containing protein [Paenibacillus sediminis]MBP1937850.1 uncharacterized membrane protein YgdD (TMEM256/DUF423 family) [Paenibacillus sediminis]
MQRRYIQIGAVMAMLSVAIGAFGAHILKSHISSEMMEVYHTGVQYHMIHAIGIILIALAAGQWGESRKLLWAARLLFVGIILFSGSLYVLSISGVRILGAITPLGGVSFIAGWLMFAAAAVSIKK